MIKGRDAFEFLYERRKEEANPNGINHEYEHGILKGIIDLAHMADIITTDELSKCYDEIAEIYSPIKRLEHTMKKYSKAE